jgi:hypothetical protein
MPIPFKKLSDSPDELVNREWKEALRQEKERRRYVSKLIRKAMESVLLSNHELITIPLVLALKVVAWDQPDNSQLCNDVLSDHPLYKEMMEAFNKDLKNRDI